MKILILANHFNTLRIFRRELIKTISQQGNDVVISIPTCDNENKQILESYGAKVIFTDFERRGMNPLKDFRLFLQYRRLIKDENPDKVIAYTIKCNIYGGFACRLLKVPHYANITGLGSTFQQQNLTRKLVSFLYKISLRRSKRVFFENVGNQQTILNDKILKPEQTYVLPGAGVNLREFSPVEYPNDNDTLHFLFVGRIMREKGVNEYFEAIKKIKAEFPKTVFDFIGWYEDDYESIVKSMQNDGLLNFHGFQSDVKPFIANAHCVVLPSWHEGMSNTLLESAAMCRPLITTNIHGCKESVINEYNGFLTEPKNSESLYLAIKRFISMSQQEKIQMGLNGRKHMEESFDKDMVVNLTIQAIFE